MRTGIENQQTQLQAMSNIHRRPVQSLQVFRLPKEQLDLLKRLLNAGEIKDVERELNISYPTVRKIWIR